MAANALKKITTRAKQIYKKGGTWKTAIKKAGAEYRSGRVKKRRKVSGTLSSGGSNGVMGLRRKKRRKVSGTLSSSGSNGVMGVRRKKRRVGAVTSSLMSDAAISGLTATQHLNKAKQKLDIIIGDLYTKIFKAKTKVAKRKLGKKMTELKSKYRKLC
jgi:hypothetical protein